MLKKSIGWHSRLILVMLATISLHVSYAQFTMQQKKPPPTYKGNLDAVVSVKYGAIMLSKKVKGQFLMTGDHEWTQYGGDSNVIWRELVRKDNGILLVDNTGEKQVELDLAEMQVNKVGKGSGTSIMHGIKEVKEGVLPGEQPNTEMANQPGTDINNPTSPSFTQSPVKEAEIIPDIPEMKETPVFHAILIAENNYADKGFNSLPGTVRDMRKLYNLLTTSYSFLPGNTDTLVNASREKILSTLNAKTKKLTENDNLFIFYAGHGWVKPIADAGSKEEGFLIPCDAVKDDEITFINSDDIVRILNRGSKAKHILFTADACFAGSLFRDVTSDAPLTVKDAYKDKSRRLLSSGNRQTVPDESEFVANLERALQQNQSKYITAEQLVDGFKQKYMEKTNMRLQYYPIQGVGDMGGQFVFIHQ